MVFTHNSNEEFLTRIKQNLNGMDLVMSSTDGSVDEHLPDFDFTADAIFYDIQTGKIRDVTGQGLAALKSLNFERLDKAPEKTTSQKNRELGLKKHYENLVSEKP